MQEYDLAQVFWSFSKLSSCDGWARAPRIALPTVEPLKTTTEGQKLEF